MGYGEGDGSTMSSGSARRGCDTQHTTAMDDSQNILPSSESDSDPRILITTLTIIEISMHDAYPNCSIT